MKPQNKALPPNPPREIGRKSKDQRIQSKVCEKDPTPA